MKIARIFPRKTKASPVDELCFFDIPPMLCLPEIDEVHVSIVFTYDIPRAEALAYQWETVGVPVKIGGPAYDNPGGEFIPGMYLKKGYLITSRGCPNNCWFCKVPKREGGLRELEIKQGWNILDDNLLACSDNHIKSVFEMLRNQPQQPLFTGGLEAALFKPWHAEEMKILKTKRMYFAYDITDDYEPLVEAGKKLRKAGFTARSHSAYAYVLIGYKGDTFEKAEKRLKDTIKAGFMPYAMLYRDEKGNYNKKWTNFRDLWLMPAQITSKNKDLLEQTINELDGFKQAEDL